MSELLVNNPFNQLNVQITLNDVQFILRSHGLPTTVHNFEYYKLAFVHKSYTTNCSENVNSEMCEKPTDCVSLQDKSNERLEFLGDGILEAVTKFYLYKRFPDENEGFMTEKKIALVKNETIGKLAYDLKLNKWLLLNNSAEEKKNRSNYKKLGCLFEAFIGAMFLDMNQIDIKDEGMWFRNTFTSGPGFQLVQLFIENVFEQYINWNELLHCDDNYKNKLQMLLQKEFKITPEYLEIDRDSDGFYMGVYLCVGTNIHSQSHDKALTINSLLDYCKERFPTQTSKHVDVLNMFKLYISEKKTLFIILGAAKHKIKRKAEKDACEQALMVLESSDITP